MGETSAHLRLKRLAAKYLVRLGFQAAAHEVRCPFSRFILDVAAYADALPYAPAAETDELARSLWGATTDGAARLRRRRTIEPRTVIIECKQSRADFLRDGKQTAALIARREALQLRAREIEETLVKPAEPHLQQSSSFLFNEMESWDFSASSSATYRRVQRELRKLDEQIHGQTKFWMIARYRLADRLYIFAPAAMIERRELPRAWGLIECPPGLLSRAREPDESATPEEILRVAVRSADHDSPPARRQRLLRNIAVAATRSAQRHPQ